jgi:hypothetical protein
MSSTARFPGPAGINAMSSPSSRLTGNLAQVSKVVNDDALLSAGPGLSP